MQRIFAVIFMAPVLLGFLGSREATAQIGMTAKSMEWQVARSDVVIRATITKVVRDKPRRETDQLVDIRVTLKVLETLKGKKSESITYLTDTMKDWRIYEAWRDARLEFIVFLVRNKDFRVEDKSPAFAASCPLRDFGDGWNLLRLGPPVPAEDGVLMFPGGIFDMKLNVAVTPDQILRSVRQAALFKQEITHPKSHDVRIPGFVMQWSGRSGDVNHIIMPIDSRLEFLARELIRIPGEILSKRGNSRYKRKKDEEHHKIFAKRLGAAKTHKHRRRIKSEWRRWTQLGMNELREEGAKALCYFKSNENIAMLKPLLHDHSVQSEIHNDYSETVYYIRKAAYETLLRWSVKVKKLLLVVPGSRKKK